MSTAGLLRREFVDWIRKKDPDSFDLESVKSLFVTVKVCLICFDLIRFEWSPLRGVRQFSVLELI